MHHCIWITIVNFLQFIHTASILDSKSCSSYPCLIFEEDFNTFDFSTWKHWKSMSATGNQEFQYYTNNRTNSYINDSILYLKPTLTSNTFDDEFLKSGSLDLWGDGEDSCTSNRGNNGCFRTGTEEEIIHPIQSAAITTQNSFSFRYGKMEVRAQLPIGDWLWPAVWLMPKYSEYGKWPASGEIDLLESRGNSDLTRDDGKTLVGIQRVSQSLHWGPFYGQNGQPFTLAHTNKEHGTFADKYFKYLFTWNPHSMIFYINDKLTLNVTLKDQSFWEYGEFNKLINVKNPWKSGNNLAPFDKEFYIILNLAVGGTVDHFHTAFLPKMPWDNAEGRKAKTSFWKARDKWLPTWKGEDSAFKIDYVKVWKLEKDP